MPAGMKEQEGAQEPPDAAPDIGGTTRSAGSGGVTCACSPRVNHIEIRHSIRNGCGCFVLRNAGARIRGIRKGFQPAHVRASSGQLASQLLKIFYREVHVTHFSLVRKSCLLADGWLASPRGERWFGLPQLDMSLILWQVLHGLNPIYDGAGYMQFNLQSGEVPVFTAGKVTFAE